MHICKFCSSNKVIKSGITRGVQRYHCKDCKRHYVLGDKRQKYDNKIKSQAVVMYLNNCGFRAIGRILDIPFQLVHHWIKQAGKIVEEEVNNRQKNNTDIDVLEMDELFTFVEKNAGKYEYGLLLIGTEMKLLRIT